MSLASACLISDTPGGQESNVAPKSKVTQLMSKDLPDFPGKEAVIITVDYPPASSDPVHRHYGNAFVCVLEGTVVMQGEAESK